jgi:hypothetical protein
MIANIIQLKPGTKTNKGIEIYFNAIIRTKCLSIYSFAGRPIRQPTSTL